MTAPYSMIEIYDRKGNRLDQIKAVSKRSWVLNAVGKAEWEMSINDPKCTRRNLQFGNLVMITHPQLPPWGGIIDTPRSWGNGKVTITANSAEQLFAYRNGLKDTKCENTPGGIYDRMISIANQAEDSRLRPGNIDGSGDTVTGFRIAITPLLDQVLDVAKKANNYFTVEPGFDTSGCLVFNCNWYRKFVNATPYMINNSRVQVQDNLYVEQGKIANSCLYYDNGANWDVRAKGSDTNAESIEAYGLREVSVSDSDTSTSAALERKARTYVKKNGEPRKTYNIYIAPRDENDMLYTYTRLGNMMTLELPYVGFYDDVNKGLTTTAWIRGMDFDDGKQTIKLTIDDEELT